MTSIFNNRRIFLKNLYSFFCIILWTFCTKHADSFTRQHFIHSGTFFTQPNDRMNRRQNSFSYHAIMYRNAREDDLQDIAQLISITFEDEQFSEQPFFLLSWLKSLQKKNDANILFRELRYRYTDFVVGGKKHAMIVGYDDGRTTVSTNTTSITKLVAFLEVGLLPSPILVNTSTYEGNVVWTRPDVLFLGNVAVASSYRRQGIGSKLIRVAEEVSKKFNETVLYAGVESSNNQALQMYEKLGFVEVLDEAQLIQSNGINLKVDVNENSEITRNSERVRRLFLRKQID